MNVFALFLAIVMPSSMALAGTDWAEVGNGGDVIVCESKTQLAHYRFYDVYESLYRYQKHPAFPKFQEPPRMDRNPGYDQRYVSYAQEIAKNIIRRLEKHDAAMTLQLLAWADNFGIEANFLAGELSNIPDEGIIALPKTCELKQLVVQRTPVLPEDRLYWIARDHWKNMSLENQAATIVHEVIYRYALAKNPNLRTSVPVRYLNMLLLTTTIDDVSPEDFAKLRQGFGF